MGDTGISEKDDEIIGPLFTAKSVGRPMTGSKSPLRVSGERNETYSRKQ